MKLSPSVTAVPLPLPKMRRASLSAPSATAPACRSRDSARDTGTPSRASRSAGATVASQRAWPWRTCISVIARTPLGTVIGTPRMPPGAETGPKTNASPARVLASCTMQTPDAPRLAADGKVTAMAKYIATAASVALPPACRTSRPTSAARLSSAATAANLTPRSRALSGARLAATPDGLARFSGDGLTSATSREQKRANQRQLAQLTARPAIHSLMVSRAARDPTHLHPLLCRAARAHAAS